MDIGKAMLNPCEPVVAGTCGRWEITYEVGEHGLAPDGRVVFVIPKAGWSSPKLYMPAGSDVKTDVSQVGFVLAEVSRPGVGTSVELDTPPRGGNYGLGQPGGTGYIFRGWTATVSAEQALAPGDTVVLIYGDLSSGSPGACCGVYGTPFHPAYFEVLVDPDGSLSGPDAGYHTVPGDLSIYVLPAGPVTVAVTAPSVLPAGEGARVQAVARDVYDNACPAASDRLLLDGTGTRVTEGGAAFFSNVRLAAGSGMHRLGVRLAGHAGVAGRSNPVMCAPRLGPAGNERIFWGDLHVHCYTCDGLGTFDTAYEYARNMAGLDFAGIATHDTLCTDADWQDLQRAAREHSEEQRFLAFLGYEYSERRVGGDKTVVFKALDDAVLRCIDDGSRTPLELWASLRGRDVITIPHSCTHRSMGTNWACHDAELQRLVEIHSSWGTSEFAGNPWPVTQDHQHELIVPDPGKSVQDGLATGARVGVMGSSDNHSGQPGYCTLMGSWARRRAYRGGIVGVLAPELTREAVWDALWNRRCYGTTGERIILRVEADGLCMGQETVADGDPRTFRVLAAGTAPLARVEIVRNGEAVHVATPKAEDCEFEWQDAADLGPLFIRGQHAAVPFVYYYVRVTQEDGHKAWSSPIWFTAE